MTAPLAHAQRTALRQSPQAALRQSQQAALRPRPVFCVIEHLHQSLAAADDARVGRFTCAGATLDLGDEPDWLRDGLAEDEEWRIEWSKLYVGLDLAWAHRQTGDPSYLRTWESLVRSWIAQVPPDGDPSDVIGRRLQNWVYAWQGFTTSGREGPSPDTVAMLASSIAEQLEHLRTHLTPERNHRTLELYTLLVVPLALPDLDPEGTLRAFAWEQLQRNLTDDVWPDGVHRECSSHYALVALRSFVGARENARRFALDVPAAYDERLLLALRFALHLHRPDGRIPALSDADVGDHTALLDLAGRLLDAPELHWVATAGAAGTPPVERGAGFPYGGYFTQRSGWGESGDPYADERYLVLDAGPVGDGGHGHYDALSVEAYGLGRPLVVDPGRYTYSESTGDGTNWRHWFKGTAAHNTVTVDGLDSTPYRRGKPRKGTTAQARLLARHAAGGLDVLRARVASAAYDAVHSRQVAFVAGEYWVLTDDLAADTAHVYEHRLHLPPAAWQHTEVVRRDADVVVRAPGVGLVYPAGERPDVGLGWVAEEYGIKAQAPVVTVASHGCDARFTVLIVPLRDAQPAPELELAGPSNIRVKGVGDDDRGTDHLAWAPQPAPLRLGPLAVTARLAWARVGSDGRLQRLAVYDGAELAWSGAGPVPDPVERGDGWRVVPDAEEGS